jgi:mRNA-degrading endonuclease toxin of MazEF toxin-antitoxin module
MSSYKIGDIFDVEVEFQEQDERRKTRPVVIVDIEDGDPVILTIAALTGAALKNPPTYHDSFKVPLNDWQSAGLKKESYVKSHPGNIGKINPSALKTHRGTLSQEDLDEVLKNINQ